MVTSPAEPVLYDDHMHLIPLLFSLLHNKSSQDKIESVFKPLLSLSHTLSAFLHMASRALSRLSPCRSTASKFSSLHYPQKRQFTCVAPNYNEEDGPPGTARSQVKSGPSPPKPNLHPPSSGAKDSSPKETSSAQSQPAGGVGRDSTVASGTESARGGATDPVEDVKPEEAAQAGGDRRDEDVAGASRIAGRKG